MIYIEVQSLEEKFEGTTVNKLSFMLLSKNVSLTAMQCGGMTRAGVVRRANELDERETRHHRRRLASVASLPSQASRQAGRQAENTVDEWRGVMPTGEKTMPLALFSTDTILATNLS